MLTDYRFLLLQIRKPEDKIREHEIGCFSKAIGCPEENILPFDLITARPTVDSLDSVDAILIGGSGDYSVVDSGDWFVDAMRFFRLLCDMGKPTFGSCWGFQALAKALGGKVVTDLKRAEVGTMDFRLTHAGANDEVFAALGESFKAQIGHQDIVDQLPPQAELLCSTDKVENQAFVLTGKPIYGTQFHPELELDDLVSRLVAYPEYVQDITGLEINDFVATCTPTPGVSLLLRRFVSQCLSTR